MSATSTIEADNLSRPRLGISECLMGAPVRFNGGHKRSRYCADVLAKYVDFDVFCPEVAIGLPVPRPPIRMVDDNGNIRVIATDRPDHDYAPVLVRLADEMAPRLRGLSGYIFMQKSPSCGVNSSKVYSVGGALTGRADGAFAGRLKECLPHLPVTEAGQLNDAAIRENFIARVYAYWRWQTLVMPNLSITALTDFHHRYKLLLQLHDEKMARQMGWLLACGSSTQLDALARRYIELFMVVTEKPAPRRRHAANLMKVYRFLKKHLTGGERDESRQLIEQYRDGIVPLVVPTAMFKFFLRKYDCAGAIALIEPYPVELGLHNEL